MASEEKSGSPLLVQALIKIARQMADSTASEYVSEEVRLRMLKEGAPSGMIKVNVEVVASCRKNMFDMQLNLGFEWRHRGPCHCEPMNTISTTCLLFLLDAL
jgi:hypothetical protein